MKTATTLQENCGDILADAREINEQRAAEDDAVVEDTAEEKLSSFRYCKSLPRGRGRWPSKARSDECVFAAATRSRDTAEQSALISRRWRQLPPRGKPFYLPGE